MLERNNTPLMRAVLLPHTGAPEVLQLTQRPIPAVRPGWVLIRVTGFGLNHSEVLLRRHEGDAPYIHLPVVPGIECAGVIADASDSGLPLGATVIALMGGMGRSFDGSYAEYTLVPRSQVFAVHTTLEPQLLVAVPESYYTAYGSLSTCLNLHKGETLLVRGGTSTVGLAAIRLGRALGAHVIATTRSEAKIEWLISVGAHEVYTESETLKTNILSTYPQGVDKLLELIGPATLRESLQLTCRGGIVCQTGILGGVYSLDDFDAIKEIPNGVYLTGFYSNRPTPDEIDGLFRLIEEGGVCPDVAHVFRLEEIVDAHRLLESGRARGKIVVVP
jgi:NADPH:quinone reductase-like Zn-dependent oxidoreductase